MGEVTMARKPHRHKKLYLLTCEDVETVADQTGISRRKLTQRVIDDVQEGIGDRIHWFEVVEGALESALEKAAERSRK